MNLVQFDRNNNLGALRNQPSINIDSVKGIFRFSKNATDALNITDGSGVVVHQDEQNPRDWYLEIEPVQNIGFPINLNTSAGFYYFNAIRLAERIMMHARCQRASFQISANPVAADDKKLYLIVMNPFKVKQMKS